MQMGFLTAFSDLYMLTLSVQCEILTNIRKSLSATIITHDKPHKYSLYVISSHALSGSWIHVFYGLHGLPRYFKEGVGEK